MNDTIDHLQQATLRLSQEGSLKDRLTEAYANHLLDIDPCGLPEAVRADFEAMHLAMHSVEPLPRECAIRASVRKMSIAEVRTHASLVVRTFALLARGDHGQVAQHRVPRAAASSPIVALFAEA
jgi:hypothetical protein